MFRGLVLEALLLVALKLFAVIAYACSGPQSGSIGALLAPMYG
jgi:hypothetical protein